MYQTLVRSGGVLAWVCASLLAVVPCRAAMVVVTPSIAQSPTLHVGDMLTVTVKGTVVDPQDGNDGIFTFDQDFIIAPSLGDPSPFQIVSVNRPGVDDLLYGGSDGTAVSTGLNDIYGGYDGLSEGIGMPVTLYTVQLKAISTGTATLSSGPSVSPYGADFTLNESMDPAVDYVAGPTVQVVSVPEPGVIAAWGVMLLCVVGMRTRRPQGCRVVVRSSRWRRDM